MLFLSTFLLAAGSILFFGQRYLIFPAPQFALAGPPPGYQIVRTTTADGLNLRAAFKEATDGLPTLLFFHGNGDSLSGAQAATRALTEAGYGALLVEYRGYGGNPGTPSERGLYHDAHAAMAWLHQRGIMPEHVVVVGNSLGSGPATEIASRHDFAALVLVSGFSSLPIVITELYPFIPAQWLLRDRFDNAAKISRVKSPILIVHGKNDTLVRPANSRRLAKAAATAKLVLMDGYGHELAYEAKAQAQILQWLQKLPPRAVR